MNIIHTSHYRFGFDPWGLLLFLLVMLPNFIWFAVPAPNDILRTDSVTPVVDAVGSVFQVLPCLPLLRHPKEQKQTSLFFPDYRYNYLYCNLLYRMGALLHGQCEPHRHPLADRPALFGVHPLRRRPQEHPGSPLRHCFCRVSSGFRGREFCVENGISGNFYVVKNGISDKMQ